MLGKYDDHDQPWTAGGRVIVDIESVWPTTPYQHKFLYPSWYNDQHRWLQLFLGGRGTGKSYCLVRRILLAALENPGCPVLLLGRTGRELRDKLQPEMNKALRQFFEATGIQLATFSAVEQAYNLINGSTIFCRPYGRRVSRDLCAGYTVAAIGVDEEARAQVDGRETFNILYPALRHPDAVRPAYIVTTSPDGLKGFVEHVYKLQKRELEGDIEAAQSYIVTASIEEAVASANNPNGYLRADYVASMRATMSKSAWEQEGKGRILRPTGLVYSVFDPEVHCLKDWRWNPEHPYVLATDPGPNHAYFCIIQVDPTGRWVVAYEEKHESASEELTEVRFRKAIKACTDKIWKRHRQRPYFVASDRANRDHLDWLIRTYGDDAEDVSCCKSKAEYDIKRGVALVTSMFDPADGDPKLYLGPAIKQNVEAEGRGMYGSLLSYRWERHPDGRLSDKPFKGQGATDPHPLDALRYAIMCARNVEPLHGGDVIPFDRWGGSGYMNPDDSDKGYMIRAA